MPESKRVINHGGFTPHRPLPIYANNAAALAAGEPYGELFAVADRGSYIVQMVNTTTTTTTTTTTGA